MHLLDASAVIAFLAAERSAPDVRAIIDEGPVVMTPMQLAEVIDKLHRGRGVPIEAARRALSELDVTVAPITHEIGVRAGALRARRYHRTERALSLADCVLIAAAASEDRVVSADRALLTTAQAEGVGVVVLPPSR